MSQENVEVVRRAYDHFRVHGRFLPETLHPDFVWDMSKFTGWPEQQLYHGLEGAAAFMANWIDTWEDWDWEVESLHDAGVDKVVAVMRQRGRSKSSGIHVEMRFAQLFTLRDGKQLRMEMYARPDEAFEAAGLAG